jgi:hypothetical protein
MFGCEWNCIGEWKSDNSSVGKNNRLRYDHFCDLSQNYQIEIVSQIRAGFHWKSTLTDVWSTWNPNQIDRLINCDQKVSRINSDFEFVPLKIHSKEISIFLSPLLDRVSSARLFGLRLIPSRKSTSSVIPTRNCSLRFSQQISITEEVDSPEEIKLRPESLTESTRWEDWRTSFWVSGGSSTLEGERGRNCESIGRVYTTRLSDLSLPFLSKSQAFYELTSFRVYEFTRYVTTFILSSLFPHFRNVSLSKKGNGNLHNSKGNVRYLHFRNASLQKEWMKGNERE